MLSPVPGPTTAPASGHSPATLRGGEHLGQHAFPGHSWRRPAPSRSIAVARLGGGPVAGPRGVAPVGDPSPGESEREPVVGQHDGRRPAEDLGLAAAQPVQLGDGEARHRDAPAGLRPSPPGPRAARRASSSVSGADSVSFHSLAGRRTSPSSSRTTRPCCCAATARAAGRCVVGHAAPRHRRRRNAVSHSRGSCSLRGGVVGGCGARPDATTVPVSRSQTWTLQADVDESTPSHEGH